MKTIEYCRQLTMGDIKECQKAVNMSVVPNEHISRKIISDLYGTDSNYILQLLHLQNILLRVMLERTGLSFQKE